MAFIRDNEDYYASLGMNSDQIKLQMELDKANINYGYCNPIRAKLAAEQEEEIRLKLKNK